MFVARLYLQMGTYLDYYTGSHDPSISATLRNMLPDPDRTDSTPHLRSLIPAADILLFPQYSVDANWPPTFLIHGDSDTAVRAHESSWMESAMRTAGVEVTLRIIQGEEHSFDYSAGAEQKYGQAGGLFDEAVDFLLRHLRSAGGH